MAERLIANKAGQRVVKVADKGPSEAELAQRAEEAEFEALRGTEAPKSGPVENAQIGDVEFFIRKLDMAGLTLAQIQGGTNMTFEWNSEEGIRRATKSIIGRTVVKAKDDLTPLWTEAEIEENIRSTDTSKAWIVQQLLNAALTVNPNLLPNFQPEPSKDSQNAAADGSGNTDGTNKPPA